MRLGPGGGAYGALIGASKNSEESVDDVKIQTTKNNAQNSNYEEQKIRSSSVLSSGQTL